MQEPKHRNLEFHLYLDDSGSRDPKAPSLSRVDRMDHFALGGFLIKAENVEGLLTAHRQFCDAHGIDYPLHSWAIRGGREKFGWLKNPEKAFAFLSELERFLLGLPVIGIAAVIDRPGFAARNDTEHHRAPLPIFQTAFCELVERAAKFSDLNGRSLRVFFERSGRAEDRSMVSFMRDLKKSGKPFDGENREMGKDLSGQDFVRIVMGDPRGRTKATPMIQVADLMLYPMVKGGYDRGYRPYESLLNAGRLIDSLVDPKDLQELGIKYSFLPSLKRKRPKQFWAFDIFGWRQAPTPERCSYKSYSSIALEFQHSLKTAHQCGGFTFSGLPSAVSSTA